MGNSAYKRYNRNCQREDYILTTGKKNFRAIQVEFGNFTGHKAHLMFDEADIVFGSLVRSLNSTSLTDVTTSYIQSQNEWYVPCPVKFPRWKSIFRMFSISLRLTVFLLTLLPNFIIVFLAKFRGTECNHSNASSMP
jgi:hypothetical protein